MRVVPLALLAIILAGCVEDQAPDASDPVHSGEVVLVFWNSPFDPTISEGDVNCALGGVDELEREEGARILPGASEIVFSVELPATNTGFQFGYSIEPDVDVTWLPVVRESAEQSVPVDEAQTEVEGVRWHFFYRLNTEPEQDCYTGAMVGGKSYTITAR